MEVNIVKDSENPLLKRRRIEFEVDHFGAATPSRLTLIKELSSSLSVPEDRITITKMVTLHGTCKASGVARVYDSRDRLEEWEPEHLIGRTGAAEEQAEKKKEPEKLEEKVKEAEGGSVTEVKNSEILKEPKKEKEGIETVKSTKEEGRKDA
ncbi:hypothetical protein AKJ45_02915 [candidate division MSBL1 archaeon SCGC-AAA261F19]|uniref:Small ribosomal subunit protein eS24 n=2 Tax=candidate division MSBL1 TaxID=215777 RepID=A0A133V953_9EURY|nr:hypothetical protein AKJ43_00790 [candidate division MSBL1 archaeon SCGC-AAA261D19]KXB02988.1 hypothetical protein AKJ45_02915 [candidate division MSBL1 archaeon SCGC-AAA261F19]